MEVALGSQLVVPGVDLGPHPSGKGVSEDGIGHVADPLLGHLLHLACIREVSEGLGMVIHELIELGDRQGLVLGDLQVGGIRSLDELLVP